MIKSNYIEGTNKKAFAIHDNNKEYLVTYARPVMYKSKDNTYHRIWDNYRPTCGKYIIAYNNTNKNAWLNMPVEKSDLTGEFLFEDDLKGVKLSTINGTMVLVIRGEAVLVKYGKALYRVNDSNYKAINKKYIDKFRGVEVSKEDFNNLEVIAEDQNIFE